MSLIQLVEHIVLYAANRAQERQARSAPAQDPAYPDVPDDHILLGHVLPRCPERVTLSPDARRRHVYAIGGTGTGKTNLLLRLIEADIAHGRTFAVIDLRGDLIDRILLRLAQVEAPDALAERTLLLDLRREDACVSFNPLAGEDDPYSRAFHVLSVLRRQSDSWGVQLEETLRNCLIALAATGGTLLDMDPLLHQPEFRAQILARVSDSHVRAFFARYEQLSGEKRFSWSQPVMNKVTPLLAIPRLRRLFGQRQPLPLREWMDRKPGSILLAALAVDRLHEASHLVGGLLVSAFQAAIMARVDQPEAQRVPVHLYVDEFETMATEQFESIIAEGRRFGLGLCLSHQNLSQVPVSLRHALRNNVHTQLYFQTGALDAAELAAEIAADEPRESIRTALMTQQVGEAYLVRRGLPSARVRLLHCPDPSVSSAAVQALCADILARHARPCADIDEQLAGAPFSMPPSVPAITPKGALENDPAPQGDQAKPRKRIPEQKEGTYEIRHAPVRRKLASEQRQKPPVRNQAAGSEEGDGAGEEGNGAEA